MLVDADPKTVLEGYMRQINWKEFASGWGAAVVNITVTYPLNKMIFRQMLHGIKAESAFVQLRREGLPFLYRGMLPPLCQKTLSLSIMFGIYEEVRRPLAEAGHNVYVTKTIGGLVSGTTEVLLMPFERIQTLLADRHYHGRFRNTYHAFRVVGRFYGWREYYRGVVPILLRNGPSNACFFVLRDESSKLIPKTDGPKARTAKEFLFGACIGAALSNLFYPLNVVKIAMHSKLGGRREGLLAVLARIYRERGGKVRHIYHGMHMNCARAFVSWGIMNAAYENIRDYLYQTT